jgi:hypothetical protein
MYYWRGTGWRRSRGPYGLILVLFLLGRHKRLDKVDVLRHLLFCDAHVNKLLLKLRIQTFDDGISA